MEPKLMLFCLLLPVLAATTRVVLVLDSSKERQYYHIREYMTDPSRKITFSVVISNDNESVAVLNEVCEEAAKGAVMLIDISSSNVGPLLRSFARAHDLVVATVMDESLLFPVDLDDELHIHVEPPETSIIEIIPDIVEFENMSNVALLYDDTFGLQDVPRTVLTGFTTHHIYQPINQTEEALDLLMDKLMELEIENVFIVSNSSNAGAVLGTADKLVKNGNTYNMNWFVVTKDGKVRCLNCLATLSVVAVHGYQSQMPRRDFIQAMDTYYNEVLYPDMINIDEAFLYDFIQIVEEALPSNVTREHPIHCYNDSIDFPFSTYNHTQSLEIIQKFEKKTREGVFGRMTSEHRTVRQSINMIIKKYVFKQGIDSTTEVLGKWTPAKGLNLTVDSLVDETPIETYRVVIVPEYAPFIYSSENDTVYSGFCIDLLNEIKRKLNFDYEIVKDHDRLFGSLNDDGTWNGAIKELLEKRADIAVGPISVMAERENVVDFTVPFYDPVGLTILMKKEPFNYTLSKFLEVLKLEVWGCIVASFFLFSVLMALFDRFSPFSYQNQPQLWKEKGPEKRVFTLKEGIWFCMTSLTPQELWPIVTSTFLYIEMAAPCICLTLTALGLSFPKRTRQLYKKFVTWPMNI